MHSMRLAKHGHYKSLIKLISVKHAEGYILKCYIISSLKSRCRVTPLKASRKIEEFGNFGTAILSPQWIFTEQRPKLIVPRTHYIIMTKKKKASGATLNYPVICLHAFFLSPLYTYS